MSAPKILSLVRSCKECPNRKYGSGNAYRCDLVDQIIRDDSPIAPFCPLPDYPSEKIAGLETTLISLRDKNSFGFQYAIWLYIARRLKVTLSGDGRLIHLCINNKEEGEDLYLVLDHMKAVDLRKLEVSFYGENPEECEYIVTLGMSTPTISRKRVVDGRELFIPINFQITQ